MDKGLCNSICIYFFDWFMDYVWMWLLQHRILRFFDKSSILGKLLLGWWS